MRRSLVALLAGLVTMLVWGAGTAAAEDPTAAQVAEQAAASGQAAGAGSGSTQSQPSNQNISVRVLSPGDDGDVTQTNAVSSGASATNANDTSQTAGQSQSGSGIQVAGQDSSSAQLAGALSSASQSGASNTNIPVRVLSPGGGGNVTQSNSVESTAVAANANATAQDADQSQSGGGCPCPGTGGIQTADQSATNGQAALAASEAEQKGAENKNISVRVLSPGDDGDVTQSNTVSSAATAVNRNATSQTVDQDQSGQSKCCPSGPNVQTADQDAESVQKAAALSSAEQKGATNTNIPVRVHSPGSGGDVTQSNTVTSAAAAANLNGTAQAVDQDQTGGSGPGIQTSDQSASNAQAALAASLAIQSGASNTNAPVRVGSAGDDGNVTQSNTVSSTAAAANLNATKQVASQSQTGSGTDKCCPSGPAIQTIHQDADSKQAALAASAAVQEQGKQKDKCGCPSGGNTNIPVRVDSPGGGGDVEQSNSVSSAATAANLNTTRQAADQSQSGGTHHSCCPSGPSIQTIDQSASNAQAALAGSLAIQAGASNANMPVRVGSPGGDGDVTQSNDVSSAAAAGNLNATDQAASQVQAGGGTGKCCPSGPSIQVIGQSSESAQLALAKSAAVQLGASNRNEPVRVGSPGGDGDVRQSNDVSSLAAAGNANTAWQTAAQAQAGGGIAIQALGQKAASFQLAGAASAALQLGASNRNAPVRVDSPGGGGNVSQSNTAASAALAGNLNQTVQAARQVQQDGTGKCCPDVSIQALGQLAVSKQAAFAKSLALQAGGKGMCGCPSGGNANAPVRVHSSGGGGTVTQSNSVASAARAANANATQQAASQIQAGSGIAIQALGQAADSIQLAAGLSLAAQIAHGRRLF